MTEVKRRLSEKVTEAAYLDAIQDRSLDDIKVMRDESREVENEVSFERRLCQARLDILSAELDRRAGKGEGDLLSRLPQILADPAKEGASGDASLPSRRPDFSAPRSADVPRRRVEEIVGEQSLARLMDMSDDEIRSSMEGLAAHEKNLSTTRKRVHEVLDVIQAEIIRRYTSGETDAEGMLT